jgi:hypothetical protein
MSINGRISIDAIFHDTDGTASISVLSLASSTEYTTGKALVVTGTAGTAGATIDHTAYRDASGELALLGSPAHIAFAWSGASLARLADIDLDQWRFWSKNNAVSVSQISTASVPVIQVSPESGTGTYTIIMWGAD